MRRECKFILPRTETWHHFDLQRELARLFGGFTWYEAEGGWMHEGTLVSEGNIVYTVSVEPEAVPQLRRLAIEYGQALEQHTLYFRNWEQTVEFIELETGEIT